MRRPTCRRLAEDLSADPLPRLRSSPLSEKGTIPLSTYLTIYKVGDIVDIKANSAEQKGMPHKVRRLVLALDMSELAH